jgi:hypothetical protein
LRRKKTISALTPIHCGADNTTPDKVSPVLDGIWTTLIATASPERLKTYVQDSKTCTKQVLPMIVKESIKNYEKSDRNITRSMRVLYEEGLISSRKYTKIRNSSDAVKTSGEKKKTQTTEFMPGCEIPKVLPYKSLISHIRNIDIGEVVDLETLAVEYYLEPVPGMYRPL